MKIDILTIFPEMFEGPFSSSIIKRAQTQALVEIKIHSLRNWGLGKHQVLDDRPYGGGVGMVLMLEPIFNALKEIRTKQSHVIALAANGEKFNQNKASQLSKKSHLIFIAGHYEGFDQRILDNLVDEEISIGDYVLTGGELPAMVVIDAAVRLIPNVLEKPEATQFESFSEDIGLEYPHYTRPEEFNGWKVPEILLTGNHKKIDDWRREKSVELTKKRRPDLISHKSKIE